MMPWRPPESVHGQQPQAEPKQRRWWPVVLPIGLLGLLASVLLPTGRHQWALSLVRQPSPYTTLYFDKASDLPETLGAGGKTIKLSFTIGNHEGTAVDYRYVITTSGTQRTRVLQQATRTIVAGAATTVSVRVRPRCGSSDCRVQISLPGHPEKIDFLIAVKAGRRTHG
jgi:hypothetical protein